MNLFNNFLKIQEQIVKLYNLRILSVDKVSEYYDLINKKKDKLNLLKMIYFIGYSNIFDIFEIYASTHDFEYELNEVQAKIVNILNINSVIISSLIEDYKCSKQDMQTSTYINLGRNVTLITFHNLSEEDLVDFYNNTELLSSFVLNKYNLIKMVIVTNNHRLEIICKVNRDDNNMIDNIINITYKKDIIDEVFSNNYIHNLSIVEKLTNKIDIKTCYKLLIDLKKNNHSKIISMYLNGNPTKQYDIIKVLLLSSDKNDNEMASILFSLTFNKSALLNVQANAFNIYNQLSWQLQKKLGIKDKMESTQTVEITKSIDQLSFDKKIELMKCDESIKEKAREKLNEINKDKTNSKAEQYLTGLLKIPFGVYIKEKIFTKLADFKTEISKILSITAKNKVLDKYKNKDITTFLINSLLSDIKDFNKKHKKNLHAELIKEWKLFKLDKINYLKESREALDQAVYGHSETKLFIEQIIAQWINGKMKGTIFGLNGPPGVGKTTIAKNGIAKCFFDYNNNIKTNRPFVFISLGGAQDGTILEGHNYTYQGATWGKIVDVLMEAKCMNPIIMIDELDKVSETAKGKEIINILTHLTDPIQNSHFNDKYFAGINIDLSQSIIIFSYNDRDKIDPILRDRITEIKIDSLSKKEKTFITQNYTIDNICKDIGFNKDEITISNKLIEHVIDNYTFEAGLRKLNEKLYDIFRNINLNYMKTNELVNINKTYIDKLFSHNQKICTDKIHKEPQVGIINCLYAYSGSQLGGVMRLEVMKLMYDEKFNLKITGKLEKVMRESVECAKSVAFSLLDDVTKKELKDNSFGIHVHFSDAGTTKDGPSAGAATGIALYSLLTNKLIKNDVAITGEINLHGHITKIGGLQAKIIGGYSAGLKKILIPKDNLEDYNKIKKKKLLTEMKDLKIVLVSHIKETFEHVFI